MMKTKEHIRSDTVELHLYATANPLLLEQFSLKEIFQAIDSNAGELAPQEVKLGKVTRKYSADTSIRLLEAKKSDLSVYLSLSRTTDPEVLYSFSFLGGSSPLGLIINIVVPFSYFEDAQHGQERSQEFVALARALVIASHAVYAFAHSRIDFSLGTDPRKENPFATREIYEMYWLNYFGPEMVRHLTREKVLTTPAVDIEELPNGGILLLTRPTPVDYEAEEARLAQAQGIVHLKNSVKLDDVLKTLHERNALLAPVVRNWDPEIENLLELTLDDVTTSHRQQQTARLNKYRPPAVSEWRPLKDLLEPDVDNVEATIDYYLDVYAEQLVALLHKDIPQVMQASPESLPHIDYYFWHFDYAETFNRKDIENSLVPAIGAYLGKVMVDNLNGRWVPRRNIDEAQVVVGDRVWLPLLRARHFMQSKQSALDYSLTKFYRTAEHHLKTIQADQC